MKAKLNRLYLFQRQDISLEAAVIDLEAELSETARSISKIVYPHYHYATEFIIPAFDEKIRIFPVDPAFVNHFLPSNYILADFPKEQRETMEKLMNQLEIASFVMELPEQLTNKNREYLVKLLGIALGGYYTRLANLPSHGVLNKRDHIYIQPFRKPGEDVIDHLEQLLEKYTK